MATQCLAWKIDDRRMDSFEGGPKFHLPLRCEQPRIEGELICARCLGRREKPRKKEGTYPQKWWGLITEPIDNIGPQVNKMVFSPWFLEKAKKYSLSQESMARAKKMYATAVAGVESVPPVPDVNTLVASVTATGTDEIPASQEKPKKAGRKKAVDKPAVSQQQTTAEPTAGPKEKKKPGPKPAASVKPKLAAVKPNVELKTESTQALPPITAIVENSEPVPSEDTIFIKVRHFEHGERSYYYDSSKHKLYDKKTFHYIGRWDSETERIVSDIPDSDAE
jgi:hypothetical protein